MLRLLDGVMSSLDPHGVWSPAATTARRGCEYGSGCSEDQPRTEPVSSADSGTRPRLGVRAGGSRSLGVEGDGPRSHSCLPLCCLTVQGFPNTSMGLCAVKYLH